MQRLLAFPLVFVALAAAGGARPDPARSAPGGRLTIDALIDIRHPSQAAWSPDGGRIAFVWDRAMVQDVYVVGAKDGEPKALTRHEDGLVDGLSWSRDGRHVYFQRGGDLWQVDPAGAEPARPVFSTREAESDVALSHDGARVAFARDGDLWTRSLSDGSEKRLTETPENEGEPVWSPDDRRLAFTVTSFTPRDVVPPYVGFKIAFRRQEGFRVHVGAVAADGGPVVAVARGDGTETAPRWLDAGHVTLQRVSADLKTREVVAADAATGEGRVLARDADPKFWSLEFLGAEPVPSPDGRRVAFISDRDGWDHLYVVPAAGGDAVAVTRGAFEASRPSWSPDGRRLAFDTNQGENPGVRQLVVADLGDDAGAAPRSAALTRGRGTNIGATWSPDGARLLYQHTDPTSSADLFVLDADAKTPPAPRRLTDSMPAAIDETGLVPPRFVRYAAPDGQQVPAYLFVPAGLDRSRRHPAIVWVHGDGITQNFDGWHTRRDYAVYYSVHQYFAQRGYVVLAVDYRGSIGYGRDWRQGHYRDLGGKDYEDIAAGVGYLKTLGFVDTSRLGVWGLSYGGFMALQALTVTPELFRCGIDVAGVQDWADWYADPDGPWIRGRMGRPEDEPELYRRSSPIHKVDRIVRPLLVMHGTADVNVPFLESVRLVDAALKAGKDVEFVMYPGELHYFHRGHVLRDAWKRAERFFDSHLRGERPRRPPLTRTSNR
jgi:dipeptidyl aminopeptidase/acylaminoacyl peptidase